MLLSQMSLDMRSTANNFVQEVPKYACIDGAEVIITLCVSADNATLTYGDGEGLKDNRSAYSTEGEVEEDLISN